MFHLRTNTACIFSTTSPTTIYLHSNCGCLFPVQDMLLETWLLRNVVLLVQPAIKASAAMNSVADAFDIVYTTSGN